MRGLVDSRAATSTTRSEPLLPVPVPVPVPVPRTVSSWEERQETTTGTIPSRLLALADAGGSIALVTLRGCRRRRNEAFSSEGRLARAVLGVGDAGVGG
jgi:hypothetical protein